MAIEIIKAPLRDLKHQQLIVVPSTTGLVTGEFNQQSNVILYPTQLSRYADFKGLAKAAWNEVPHKGRIEFNLYDENQRVYLQSCARKSDVTVKQAVKRIFEDADEFQAQVKAEKPGYRAHMGLRIIKNYVPDIAVVQNYYTSPLYKNLRQVGYNPPAFQDHGFHFDPATSKPDEITDDVIWDFGRACFHYAGDGSEGLYNNDIFRISFEPYHFSPAFNDNAPTFGFNAGDKWRHATASPISVLSGKVWQGVFPFGHRAPFADDLRMLALGGIEYDR